MNPRNKQFSSLGKFKCKVESSSSDEDEEEPFYEFKKACSNDKGPMYGCGNEPGHNNMMYTKMDATKTLKVATEFEDLGDEECVLYERQPAPKKVDVKPKEKPDYRELLNWELNLPSNDITPIQYLQGKEIKVYNEDNTTSDEWKEYHLNQLRNCGKPKLKPVTNVNAKPLNASKITKSISDVRVKVSALCKSLEEFSKKTKFQNFDKAPTSVLERADKYLGRCNQRLSDPKKPEAKVDPNKIKFDRKRTQC